MSETVLAHLGDGAPDAGWLNRQADDYYEKAKKLVCDEKGVPLEAVTPDALHDAEAFEAEGQKYRQWAEDADGLDRSKRQSGIADRIKSAGSKIAEPESDGEINPFMKGGAPGQGNAKARIISGFETFVTGDKFKAWREANLDTNGKMSAGAAVSPQFSLGDAKSFLTGERVKRVPINSAGGSPNFADDGTFIGEFHDAGSVYAKTRDNGILDHVDMITVDGGIARWTVHGSPTLAARWQDEVVDTANITTFGRKPYSTLGTIARMEVPLRTMAHMFEATTQALDSDDELEAMINGLGRRGLVDKLGSELLNGDHAAAGGDTLTGLLNTPGVSEISSVGSPFVLADSIRKKTRYMRATIKRAKHNANKLMMNQLIVEQWLDEDEVAGREINRFYNPVTGVAVATLHGLEVVETEDMNDDRILAGEFHPDFIRLYNNGEIEAKMTDSHADNFELNLLTWRFEWALALAVLVPEAFLELQTNV